MVPRGARRWGGRATFRDFLFQALPAGFPGVRSVPRGGERPLQFTHQGQRGAKGEIACAAASIPAVSSGVASSHSYAESASSSNSPGRVIIFVSLSASGACEGWSCERPPSSKSFARAARQAAQKKSPGVVETALHRTLGDGLASAIAAQVISSK